MKRRIALSWSSGKDSAWALHVLRQSPELQIEALITTFNSTADRVAMHAVRRRLVQTQAESVGVPLWPVELPWPCANADYEALMAELCRKAISHKLDGVAFGDLFLQDVREYREKQLCGTGLEPLFPLWGRPTEDLAREVIGAGLRAKLTCIDPAQLSPDFVGCEFDLALLDKLPTGVDPCGERGEFHTFAYEGPMFKDRIEVQLGEIVQRDGFVFADLL